MRPEKNAITESIAVVIVHYRSPFSLERCLTSLRAASAESPLNIWVVDNASPDWDEKAWRSRFPEVHFISRHDNGGYSVAANTGIRASEGEKIVLLNADTFIWSGAIPTLSRFMQMHPHAGLVGPKILNRDGRLQLSCRAFPTWWTPFFSRYSPLTLLWPKNPLSHRYILSRDAHQRPLQADWLSGSCLMINRKAFEDVKGFDEAFFLYMEDVDLCLRMHHQGWKVFYVPEAIVRHDIGSASSQRKARAIWEHHKSIWRYYRKHFKRNFLKDALIFMGTAARCGLEIAWMSVKKIFYAQGGDAYREPLLKRGMDIALALLGLILTLPLWMLVPLLIWLQDRGAIFYRQLRVGRDGRTFHILKFRTMVMGADQASGPLKQSHTDDPRITPLGRWLRRAAIDEIPQLVSILVGQMSLVGPRALVPEEIEVRGRGQHVHVEQIPGWERRRMMRPGLTGIAQVFGRRDLPRRQKFRYDLLYLEGRSIFFDLKLILLSVWISLTGSWGKRGHSKDAHGGSRPPATPPSRHTPLTHPTKRNASVRTEVLR